MTRDDIRTAILATPALEALARITGVIQVHQRDEHGLVLRDQATGEPLPLVDIEVPQPDTAEVARLLSAGRTCVASVPRATFARWAAATGMRAAIADHAINAQSPLRASALALLDVLNGAAESIDFGAAENLQMLQAWVTVDALSAEDRDALVALATVPDPVPEMDVRLALLADDGSLLL